ncbi:gluconokinase [Demequina sp.]|uniref:gluconokinase n=1 Tax=Demequina sp. TaxID=2050685 RepID=UPI003A8BD0E4
MRVVVMGVTGCGKSSVARGLADALGAPYGDADDLHSADAVAAMAAGVPLTDEDRWPWLARVGMWLAEREDAVMACSALKRSYREALRDSAGRDLVFVHLSAPQHVLEGRVAARTRRGGHFAGTGLLASQFAILEPLAADERGVVVDVTDASVAQAVGQALAYVRGAAGEGS